jgi:NAD(P)-dependent dehydrogenase (short-subunit alcohol dehydrogenase family)
MADAQSKPVWFITGCSTGFGRELSAILLKRGYRVVVTARDKAKVEDIVAGHDKSGLALKLDVDKQDQIDAAVKAAEARFGRIDVLVNNAGYGYLAAVEEADDADVRAMFDTNFFGLASMTRAVLPIMRAQKSGAIVNISSIGGKWMAARTAAYAASKAGIHALTAAMSQELGPDGVRVNAVCPGIIDTYRMDDVPRGEAWDRLVANRVPLGRAGTGQDVAWLVVYLCSDQGSWISGQFYSIDGGTLPGR